MRLLVLNKVKQATYILLASLMVILPAKSDSLSDMVSKVLESHEDILNAKKRIGRGR